MAKLEQIFVSAAKSKEVKHPKRTIQWIHYTKLTRSAYQMYSEAREEVIALAEMIRLDGEVLQNIRIRKIDVDEYEIIAGHKRTLACRYLVEEMGMEQFEFLPCIVTNISDVCARFQVMSSNWYHEKTPYEIMLEIEDMEYLLTHYPEEFPDIEARGRMVEKLAKKMKLGRSVVSDYKNIAKNLSEEGKEALREEKIDKSAAVQLAGLEKEQQRELLQQGNVTYTGVKDFKHQKESLPERAYAGFPELKNMDQREAFVKEYLSWSVWTKNKLTEETFYRYELPDKSAIVVRHYPCTIQWANEEIMCQDYYLLKPSTQHFKDAETSMTELKEHLRQLRKG